jgi:hypothetical protein
MEMRATEMMPEWLVPPRTKKHFASVRGRVRIAARSLPRSVTLSAAKAQIRRFEQVRSTTK